MSKEVATNKPKELFEWNGEPEDQNLNFNLPADGMKPITGTKSTMVGLSILSQAAMVPYTFHEKDSAVRLNNTAKKMREIDPQDGLESMLASQMIQASDMAAECMRRAAIKDQYPESIERNINQAVKLMRVFREGLEALNKHRGKGNQKITVEHVTVNEGGQAIVGNVHHGGGAKDGKQG